MRGDTLGGKRQLFKNLQLPPIEFLSPSFLCFDDGYYHPLGGASMTWALEQYRVPLVLQLQQDEVSENTQYERTTVEGQYLVKLKK